MRDKPDFKSLINLNEQKINRAIRKSDVYLKALVLNDALKRRVMDETSFDLPSRLDSSRLDFETGRYLEASRGKIEESKPQS